jgi:amino acid transporter
MTDGNLARELGTGAATALVVGQVIAVGIFLTPGTIIHTLASPLGVLLLWGGMGAMAICGALCYGALAARYPQAGGGYVYLRETYGSRVAFLSGWKCLLIMDPGITAALAMGFASYVAYLTPLGDAGSRLIGIAAIAAFACVHIAGVRLGVRLLTAVSALKIKRRDPAFHVPGYPWTPAVFLMMVATLLTLVGLNNPLQAALGLVLVAAALPVYRLIWSPRQPEALKETTL